MCEGDYAATVMAITPSSWTVLPFGGDALSTMAIVMTTAWA